MHHKHDLELFKVDADLTSLCRLAESEIKKSKIDREETIFKMIGNEIISYGRYDMIHV